MITLQAAFDAKAKSEEALVSAQKAQDEYNKQAPVLAQVLADALAADKHAADVLLKAASSLPVDTIAETSDGTELLVISNTLHQYHKVTAESVSYDDSATPAPAPTPTSSASQPEHPVMQAETENLFPQG